MENTILISKATCEAWIEIFRKHDVLYLHAMGGYGKTVQTKEFAKRYFTIYRYFDARDTSIFESIENLFINCEKTPEKKLIIIDNIETLSDTGNEKKLINLLTPNALDNNNTKVMLLSIAPLPKYLYDLKLSKKLIVEDKKTLEVKENQIVSFMKNNPVFDQLKYTEIKKYASKCVEFCSGYPMAAIFYLQRLAENIYNVETALKLATNDLYDYFEHKSQNLESNEFELLLRLCVFDIFTTDMAKEIIPEISKKDILALSEYGFLEPCFCDGISDGFCINPNVYQFLQRELVKTNLFDPKELLKIAGEVFEKKRNMKSALHCYNKAENYNKIEEIVIYLSENADGCEFAQICDEYMSKIAKETIERTPRLLGAKALIEAYSLRKKEYDEHMTLLKKLADEKKDNTSLEAYMRTLIACPLSNSDILKENLVLFVEYVLKKDTSFKFITPTGNMPSLLNGGLDLLPWANGNKVFQNMIKTVAQTVIGFEAVGVYNTIMGEIYYERNNTSEAVESLAKGLDEANREGSIRMQYTATAIMSRLYCAENNFEKAEEILEHFYQKTQNENFFELLPNITASTIQLSLLKNDIHFYTEWLEKHAPNEHKKFYLTQRHILFTKAKVYVALGRDLEALFIISMLEQYAQIAQRRYFAAQLLTLKAIILQRRGEDWEEHMLNAMKIASEYEIVRIFADEGAAVLPIFKKINWQEEGFEEEYIKLIEKEIKKMATLYPNYLKSVEKNRGITKKELNVLQLLAQGYKNEDVAQELGISLSTVKFHISNIMNKFEVKNRALIIKIAYEEGII